MKLETWLNNAKFHVSGFTFQDETLLHGHRQFLVGVLEPVLVGHLGVDLVAARSRRLEPGEAQSVVRELTAGVDVANATVWFLEVEVDFLDAAGVQEVGGNGEREAAG